MLNLTADGLCFCVVFVYCSCEVSRIKVTDFFELGITVALDHKVYELRVSALVSRSSQMSRVRSSG